MGEGLPFLLLTRPTDDHGMVRRRFIHDYLKAKADRPGGPAPRDAVTLPSLVYDVFLRDLPDLIVGEALRAPDGRFKSALAVVELRLIVPRLDRTVMAKVIALVRKTGELLPGCDEVPVRHT